MKANRVITILAVCLLSGVVLLSNSLISTSSARSTKPELANVISDVTQAAVFQGAPEANEALAVVTNRGSVTTATQGIQLSIEAHKVDQTDKATIAHSQRSKIVFQSGNDFFRASIHISPDSPQDFRFRVLGADHLEYSLTGGILAVDQKGHMISEIVAPWAKDALGNKVPTTFRIDNLTVTQRVNHSGAEFVYPIVADPHTIISPKHYEPYPQPANHPVKGGKKGGKGKNKSEKGKK